MIDMTQHFVEPDDLLALEPEELGGVLLRALRQGGAARAAAFHPAGLATRPYERDNPRQWPDASRPDVSLALREAWAWLEAQGLLVPADDIDRTGYRVLSRRAQRIEDPTDFMRFRLSRKLDKEALHERIRHDVWASFLRGSYSAAIVQAMKAVEVAVRDASGLQEDGRPLMQKAFGDGGPLADANASRGERVGRMELFAGAFGEFRNPHAHRDVQTEAQEAVEAIMLANYLLRVVDACARRPAPNP